MVNYSRIIKLEKYLAKGIEGNPSRWAIVLKSVYSSESIKKAITLLPPEMGKMFKRDLDLLGDLNKLGL